MKTRRPDICIRFEKRESVPKRLKVMIPVICILAAFVFCALIVLIQGHNPVKAYQKMFTSAFGGWNNISESILQSIPLMLCGLGVAMAFKMSVNNIGAEGQFMIGAFAGTAVALFIPGFPEGLTIPGMILAGFIGGAVWAIIAVLPRVLFRVNETIVTLMFNYIAIYFINYFCYGPWRDSAGSNMPYTVIFPDYAHLPTLFGTRIHIGLIIAFVAAFAIFLFYRYTTRGYQMRIIGNNGTAARYAGIRLQANILLVMLISGGMAGIAGATYVGGVVYRLQPEIANGWGYTAITIAFLAQFNPFLILLVSLLFGGMNKGGYTLQILGISPRLVLMIQGFILFFVLAGQIFVNYRLVVLKNRGGESEK